MKMPISIPIGGLPTGTPKAVAIGSVWTFTSTVVIDEAHSVMPYAVQILELGRKSNSCLKYVGCSSPPPRRILLTAGS